MKSYIAAERIKFKHTFMDKLPIIAPIVTILLTVFLMSNYFRVAAYNWWYITILPATLSLMCALAGKMEERNNQSAILTLPVSLKKVWVAKVIVLTEKVAFSCVVLFMISEIMGVLLHDHLMAQILPKQSILGCILLIIAIAWQVPLCLLLQKKLGLFGMVILNIGLNTVLSVTVSLLKTWALVPYTYAARLMCIVLKILPNGLVATEGSVTYKPELITNQGVLTSIIISIILFLGLTYLTGKSFERQGAK